MSINQEWHEAIKTSMENSDNLIHCAPVRVHQDMQADSLPTSSQSPGDSPQPSPDSQQRDLPHSHHLIGFSSDPQQDQHISQSGVPPSNTSQNYDQSTRSEMTNIHQSESHLHHYLVAQQLPGKMASPRVNEQNNSSIYHLPKASSHSPEILHRNQPQSQGIPINNSQTNNNASNISHLFPNRQQEQSQNQSSSHHQIHLSSHHQSNQQRLSLNNAPSQPHAARMTSPPRQASMLQVRQNISHQNPHQQTYFSGGQQQHFQQSVPQQPHNQKPVNPSSSAQSHQRIAAPGFSAPAVRPRFKTPPPSNHQANFPGQTHDAPLVNQNQNVSLSMTGQAMQPLTTKRNENVSEEVGRLPQQQNHPQTFSNLHQQQAVSLHKQNMGSNERMLHSSGVVALQNRAMYYDDNEEEDYDEEMGDEEEEEMEYSKYEVNPGYNYPSSDGEELSEEESALLEELRFCKDNVRYKQIVDCFQEKGVAQEEIEEMLYHSNFPQSTFLEENFDGENDDDEEDEAEGTVSSSSQGHQPGMRNHIRSYTQALTSSGQNLREETRHSSVRAQQGVPPVPSEGLNQGLSQGIPGLSINWSSQQGKSPGLSGMATKTQQPVSDHCLPAATQSCTQGEIIHFQQQELKFQGQGSQQNVFQGSADEVDQDNSETNTKSWQPIQNAIRAQNHLRPVAPRQLPPNTIPVPGQSQGFPSPRPSMLNRLPQLLTQGQNPAGVARPHISQCNTNQNNTSSFVRPVQHLSIQSGNNQTSMPGQRVQNPSCNRQTTPGQQLVINSPLSNQQGGPVGLPSQIVSPVVRNMCPQAALPLQQKPYEQQGVSGSLALTSGQVVGALRPITPISQSDQLGTVSKMKAALNRETASSEAARLNVLKMQQRLDKEIMAKKGGQSTQGLLTSPQNPNTLNSGMQSRFPVPQNLNQIPPGHLNLLRSQKPQNSTSPVYQPTHQLPPRQPIPAIINPNSSTSQTFSGGRPICSVVPFTSQNRGQACSNGQSTPQQNATFFRARNTSPVTNVGSSPQQSPGIIQNRANTPQIYGSSSHPSGSCIIVTRNLPQGNTTPPACIQSAPHQVVNDQANQVPTSKPDTFSLDHLSEDKCIITGQGKNQGLTVNMVYQIRSPIDNSLVMALWNGERFEDLKQSDVKALSQPGQGEVLGSQPNHNLVSHVLKSEIAQNGQLTTASQIGQSVIPSDKDRIGVPSSAFPTGSKFQAEFLQSLTYNDEQEEQSFPGTESQPIINNSANNDQGQNSDLKTQKTFPDVLPNQSTYVKPLPQGQSQQKVAAVEEEAEDFIFKKPFSENEDYFRVCQHCGYTSKNFKSCEGCKRVFRGEVKIHSRKKNTADTSTSLCVPESGTQNLKCLGPASKEELSVAKDRLCQGQENLSFGAAKVRGRGRITQGRSGKTKGGGLKGRMGGVKGSTGEALIGSNRNESPSERKRNSNSSGSSSDGSVKRRPARPKSKNPTPRKRSKKTNEPITVTISSDEDEPSSTSNNMSNHAPSPVHSAGSESPIFPSTPAEPINAFGRFRRTLMEDEVFMQW